jgi:four helix bundle protein
LGQSYRDLIAWQKAIELVAAIYRVTQTFPKDELYGLTSQLRRAAVSMPSNIAEGQGWKSEARRLTNWLLATGDWLLKPGKGIICCPSEAER